jgi:hypothetical protein
MSTLKEIIGTTIYVKGKYGVHSSKSGMPCCTRNQVTDAFNCGHGGYWVQGDDSGKSYRLVLDGVSSQFTAKKEPDGTFTLDSALSLVPHGDILGI